MQTNDITPNKDKTIDEIIETETNRMEKYEKNAKKNIPNIYVTPERNIIKKSCEFDEKNVEKVKYSTDAVKLKESKMSLASETETKFTEKIQGSELTEVEHAEKKTRKRRKRVHKDEAQNEKLNGDETRKHRSSKILA